MSDAPADQSAGDIRTLLGLHTRTAWFIFGLNTVVNLALIVWCGDRLTPLWLPVLASVVTRCRTGPRSGLRSWDRSPSY